MAINAFIFTRRKLSRDKIFQLTLFTGLMLVTVMFRFQVKRASSGHWRHIFGFGLKVPPAQSFSMNDRPNSHLILPKIPILPFRISMQSVSLVQCFGTSIGDFNSLCAFNTINSIKTHLTFSVRRKTSADHTGELTLPAPGNSPFFPQSMNRSIVMLQTSLLATHNIGWGID